MCREDSVRRAFAHADPVACATWHAHALRQTDLPARRHPWIMALDATVKTSYGHQEAAEVGYNPDQRGRLSHVDHSLFVRHLRLVLNEDVRPGKQHGATHSRPNLWRTWDDLPADWRPWLTEGGPAPWYEYPVLVIDLTVELLSVADRYRRRASAENSDDELKNPWGWGGFTTHDRLRCQVAARQVALGYNGWRLVVRWVEPERPRAAVTSRPLLLSAIGRVLESGRQLTRRLPSTPGDAAAAQPWLTHLSTFFSRAENRCGAVAAGGLLGMDLGADFGPAAGAAGGGVAPGPAVERGRAGEAVANFALTGGLPGRRSGGARSRLPFLSAVANAEATTETR